MKRYDFNTYLFLYKNKLNVARDNESKDKIGIKKICKHDVYIFEDYQEYVDYFKQYINDTRSELIDLAIFSHTTKGQIIALKGVCQKIIIKERMREFYMSYTQEKIDDIHSRGKLTPEEKVEEWVSNELCAPGDGIGSAGYRCCFFDNCNECLHEFASHQDEYEPFKFEVAECFKDSIILSKTKKN